MFSVSLDPKSSLEAQEAAALQRRKYFIIGGASFLVLAILVTLVVVLSGGSTTTPPPAPSVHSHHSDANVEPKVVSQKLSVQGVVSVKDLSMLSRARLWVSGHLPLVIGLAAAVVVLITVSVVFTLMTMSTANDIVPTPEDPVQLPFMDSEDFNPAWIIGVVGIVLVVVGSVFGVYHLNREPPESQSLKDFKSFYQGLPTVDNDLCRIQQDSEKKFNIPIEVDFTVSGVAQKETVYCRPTHTMAHIHQALILKNIVLEQAPFYLTMDSTDPRRYISTFLNINPDGDEQYFQQLRDYYRHYQKLLTIVDSNNNVQMPKLDDL